EHDPGRAATMKLHRLLEMIRHDRDGADEWPVFITSFRQTPTGEWHEVERVRDPLGVVVVDEAAEEVLFVGNSECVPLSVEALDKKLAELLPGCGEFAIDYCGDMPIEMDGWLFHIDVPIEGAGRDEKNRCYLVVRLAAQQ
ncbi:MAG: hypothetical protein ABFC96_13735, partial [Thermoguttaceae bacterium]